MAKVRKLPPLDPREALQALDGRQSVEEPAPEEALERKGADPIPLICGRMDRVDRRTGQKLQRGQIRPMGSIDLHGRSLSQARRILSASLRDRGDARCLLVITGKGLGKDGRAQGKLRAALHQWVNLEDIRPHLLGFCQARPRHGGDGAYYLLLRRRGDRRTYKDHPT